MKNSSSKRPYFIWDYDLTEKDIHRLLREENEYTKLWLTARILESAKYEDVWKYLTIREILEIFPRLGLKQPIRQAWEKAFRVWGYAK